MTVKYQQNEQNDEVVVLDVTGLACPMPLIKLKQQLVKLSRHKKMAGEKGQQMKIVLRASDKGALKDIPAFCTQQGLGCECIQSSPPVYQFVIRVEKR